MDLRRRILLIGPQLILRWTESTAAALESLGCHVAIVYYDQSSVRQGARELRRVLAQRLKIRLIQTPRRFQRWYAGKVAAQAGHAIVETARTFKPDLVLILKGESLQADTLRELKAVTQAPLAVWWVDHPLMNAETKLAWDRVPSCIPLYDHCFVFDHSYEMELRTAGARAIHILPCATDPDLYKPVALTVHDQTSYEAVVSLVGVHTESRAAVVSGLCGVPGLGIWGPGWQGWLVDRRAPDAFRGETLHPSEACKVYNASLVNLNVHHPQTRIAGLNTRAFEIPATGGFELTDHVPGMEALLEPSREVAVYRCPEEAAELARYYSKAEDERRRIAEAGHRRVLAEHTYRHRMQTVLATAL